MIENWLKPRQEATSHSTLRHKTKSYRVCLCSDFFYPNVGGVESHMFNVAQTLIGRGHKVIVITSNYSGERVGIRYLSNGLKVYHLPTSDMFR